LLATNSRPGEDEGGAAAKIAEKITGRERSRVNLIIIIAPRI
jgi:hypothetical protein